MGLFHLANCLVLATGPHVMVYRHSEVRENDVFWRCLQNATMYWFAQLLKLFLATFAPNMDPMDRRHIFYFDIVGVVVELLVLYFILKRISGRNELGVLIAGLGWSTCALVTNKYVPLFIGTKGQEFDWKYLILSFEANLEMVLTFCTFFSFWFFIRKTGDTYATIMCALICLATTLKTIIFGLIDGAFSNLAQGVLVKTGMTIVIGIATMLVRLAMPNERITNKHIDQQGILKKTYELIITVCKQFGFAQSREVAAAPRRHR